MFFATNITERSPTVAKPKMLNFDDSDDECGRSMVDLQCSSRRQSACRRSGVRPIRTPLQSNERLWDSGIGSPTPVSSPKSHSLRADVGSMSKSDVRNSGVSSGFISPIPFMASCDESDADEPPSSTTAPPDTPPHRRMRSLRLYDTPHTPKSLLEKSQQQRRSGRNGGHFLLSSNANSNSANASSPMRDVGKGSANKIRRLALDPSGPQANVNPFTACRKRARHDLDGSTSEESPVDDVEEERPTSSKRLALSEINTSRYVEEFHQVAKLGDGEFGSVYRCVNRLDGCTYAIKKSKMPVAGSVYERNALNEVYAHAVLGKHTHVVRYYSAWAEEDHMYIQNEFCNGGSLGDLLAEQRKTRQRLTESDLAQILMQVAQGLKYIHAQGLVHMDIKPANIFIHRDSVEDGANESGIDDEMSNDERKFNSGVQKVIYKIGDLGHVTSVKSPVVEEGDCRYLPLEILHEQYDDLPKADIFSLALTVFEAGGELELPKNGPMWHQIREEALPNVTCLSADFNGLLKLMANVNPKCRPTAASVVHHQVLCPFRRKSRAQLYRELNEEKLKNQLLKRELEFQKASDDDITHCKLPIVAMSVAGRGVRRLLGKSCARSTSLTVF